MAGDDDSTAVAAAIQASLRLVRDVTRRSATGGFKKDCTDLCRRVGLLENMRDCEGDLRPLDLNACSASSSSSCTPSLYGLTEALKAAKRLVLSADNDISTGGTGGQQITFQFKCITWKLEKALASLPYDQFDISEEVKEQVDLVRVQLKRAAERYGGPLDLTVLSCGLSESLVKESDILHPISDNHQEVESKVGNVSIESLVNDKDDMIYESATASSEASCLLKPTDGVVNNVEVGKEETFVRRFAAGGNDGVPFDPRGYGDHSRRFAARGNEMVDHENKCESGDGYHPRRFAARGNEDHDLLYDSSPIFDEYEDDVWYAWATGGSYRCGFDEAVFSYQKALTVFKASKSTIAGVEARMGVMFNMVGRHEEARAAFESVVAKLRASGERKSTFFGVVLNQMGLACVQLFKIDEAVRLNENSLSPKIAGMFAKKNYVYVAVYSLVTGGDRNLPGDYHAFSQDDRKLPLVSSKGLSIFYHIALSPTLVATPLSQQRYGGLESNLESNSRDLEYSNILGCDLKSQIQNKEKIMVAINVGISVDIFKDKNMKVNKRRSSAPFDPGGTSLEPDETPREVEQFRLVVIIAQKIGVDVPFDPGGFGPKTKLEDEFFRRGGE